MGKLKANLKVLKQALEEKIRKRQIELVVFIYNKQDLEKVDLMLERIQMKLTIANK